jgi:SAM-dependent methyltransferase
VKNPTLNADSVALFSGKSDGLLPGIAQAEPHLCVDDSLFERFPRVYIFFRERCFRNDTARIIRALWGNSQPAADTQLIELGCGPGFYARELATRYPQISVTGVDRSMHQLDWAQKKARRMQIQNCRFTRDNVLNLSHPDDSFDVVLATRLFTVLPEQQQAVGEMHRILRPGGQCLIAEPRYAFWASLPLWAMWVLARLARTNNGCREPGTATVLSPRAFSNLLGSQPWQQMRTWQDGRYQYALCQK